MIRLNVKKIIEEFEKSLDIKFEPAPEVSKKAQLFRNGINGLIINSRRVEIGCYDDNGNFHKKTFLEAADVKTTTEAITNIADYFVATNDKLDIRKIIGPLENKLNFQFETDSEGKFFIRERDRCLVISDEKMPWVAVYIDFSVPKCAPTIFTANDVKTADEAVERMSEILFNNFIRFKAENRDNQIDEICGD